MLLKGAAFLLPFFYCAPGRIIYSEVKVLYTPDRGCYVDDCNIYVTSRRAGDFDYVKLMKFWRKSKKINPAREINL